MAEEDAKEIALRALELAAKADQKVDSHEVLCAERYGNINESLKTIKNVGIALIGGILLLLATNYFESQRYVNQTHEQSHGTNR